MKKYPDVPINIEIKGRSDDDVASYNHNAEVLADYLNELGRTRGIVVASFNDAALAHFHELAPQIDLAPATGGVAGYVLGNTPPPEGSKVFQVPMTFSGIAVVTPEFVDKAHSDGYAVHPWTIDDEPTMKYLFDLGVDGIMSAQPMRLEKTMCNMDVARPPVPAGSPGQALHEEVVDRLQRAGERARPRRRCDGGRSGAATTSTAAARAPSYSRPSRASARAKGAIQLRLAASVRGRTRTNVRA